MVDRQNKLNMVTFLSMCIIGISGVCAHEDFGELRTCQILAIIFFPLLSRFLGRNWWSFNFKIRYFEFDLEPDLKTVVILTNNFHILRYCWIYVQNCKLNYGASEFLSEIFWYLGQFLFSVNFNKMGQSRD